MDSIKGKGAGRLMVLAIFVSLALLFAAACGGGDDSQPSATPAPTLAGPAPTQAPPTAESATPQGLSPTVPAATQAPAEPTVAPTQLAEATSVAPAVQATDEPQATPAPEATAQAAATPAPTVAPPSPQVATATTPPPAEPLPPCESARGGAIGNCAPEFAGTQEWINSGPLTLQELRGKVVLIDFWTYTCINCIRTLPYLQSWHERYADEGLVIVGVHTPEFEFEKLYDNVVQATKNEAVAWPVVQDNEYAVWRSYSNRFWPAKYLIDQDGVIQYRHFGEGKYAETEEEIRKLLEQVGAASEAMHLPLPENQQSDSTFLNEGERIRTRELFAGWRFVRNRWERDRVLYVGQVDPYNLDPNQVAQLEPPAELTPHRIYFNGPWFIGTESARHAEETAHFNDYLALVYSSRSVNAVLTSESGDPYQVRITVNGEYLTQDNKGDDIIIGEDGVSYLSVTEPRLYKIVEHPTWEGGQELRMASMSDDFGLYSFTFGTYEDGA